MDHVTAPDGTEIGYETHGTCEPLLLVHGSTTTRRAWAPMRPHLEPAGELVLPDRRGRGASGDADAYALGREVEDVLALLDAVDADRLFGHSYGGLCALEAARERDLERLVLYEPALLVGEHREGADLAAEMQALLDDGEREAAMELALGGMAGDVDVEDLPNWPEVVELAEVTQRELAAVEDYRLPRTLADVETETLVLTGEHSPQFLRDAATAVHDRLSNGRLVELEGLGHTGAAAPDCVAARVTEFLSDEP